MAPSRHRNGAGFTLVELMVAMAIVGILASVAYPSYRNQIIRANRAEAKAELADMSQRLQKCFTRLHAFDTCNEANHELGSKRYRIVVTVAAETFKLEAIPQGSQAADAACGTLSIDQRGNRARTGTGAMEECWRK